MNLTTEVASIEDSYENLRESGLFFQKKTVESLLSFSVVVNVLKQKCEKDEDQDFNGLCLEYWGLSASGASQTAKVGARAADLSKHMEKLPPSSRALYELTSLPNKQLEESIANGLVTPNLTVTEAKSLKLAIKDEKETKKAKKNNSETAEDNPFAVSAVTEDGKAIEGELLPGDGTAGVTVEDKPKKQKMKAPEAIDLLNINVKKYYEEACESGLTSVARLTEAYELLSGKKIGEKSE